jgi:hypothetical protein
MATNSHLLNVCQEFLPNGEIISGIFADPLATKGAISLRKIAALTPQFTLYIRRRAAENTTTAPVLLLRRTVFFALHGIKSEIQVLPCPKEFP